MRTALIYIGLNSSKGLDDGFFYKYGIDISFKGEVFDLDMLRAVSRIAFSSSNAICFIYRKQHWSDLQKAMLMEFGRSSLFVGGDRPYVVAKGFRKVGDGIFFDLIDNKPILFLPYDVKENEDLSGVLAPFVSTKRIVGIFRSDVGDSGVVYSDEVETILSIDLSRVSEYESRRDVYTKNGETPQESLFRVMSKKGAVKIATAESCTAGLVAAKIADVSGVSAFLEGGVITYSNAMKIKVLNVSNQVLRRFGAVSEGVARTMALGALYLTGADYSVSVTGIAGPTGATHEKPVGLVYVAVASKNKVDVRRVNFSGNRRIVREKSSKYAILLLREMVLDS